MKKLIAAVAIAIAAIHSLPVAAFSIPSTLPAVTGTTDGIVYGTDTSFPTGNQPWTLNTFYQTTSTATLVGLAQWGDTSINYHYWDIYEYGAHVFEFSNHSVIDCTTTTTLNDGQWHLVQTSYDGSAITQYVDGVQSSCPGTTSTAITLTGYASFGSLETAWPLAGSLAGTAFFASNLTTAEQTAIFGGGSTVTYAAATPTYLPVRLFWYSDPDPLPGTTATDSSLGAFDWTYNAGTSHAPTGPSRQNGFNPLPSGNTSSCPSGEAKGPISGACKWMIPDISLGSLSEPDCSSLSPGWDPLTDGEWIACNIEDFAIGTVNGAISITQDAVNGAVSFANLLLDLLEPSTAATDGLTSTGHLITTKIPFAYITAFSDAVTSALSASATTPSFNITASGHTFNVTYGGSQWAFLDTFRPWLAGLVYFATAVTLFYIARQELGQGGTE